MLDHLNRTAAKLLALLDVSGSGKTRSLYEALCHQFGIFLVGDPIGNGGSLDLKTWSKTLLTRLPSAVEGQETSLAQLDHNSRLAEAYFYVLICGRLIVLEQLQSMFNAHNNVLTPKQWLLLQAYPSKILGKDVFVSFCRRQ